MTCTEAARQYDEFANGGTVVVLFVGAYASVAGKEPGACEGNKVTLARHRDDPIGRTSEIRAVEIFAINVRRRRRRTSPAQAFGTDGFRPVAVGLPAKSAITTRSVVVTTVRVDK